MEHLPLILFEDEHLLVINKPAGLNTHAPAPFAGEGVYDWLRHRDPRWATLAIIHRLDKETSGVMVFAKSPIANRSLTQQFTDRAVQKKYRLLTDRPVPEPEFTVVSKLVRVGEKFMARPMAAGGDRAETRFRVLQEAPAGTWLEAEPVTGRTHQIRVHAAERGMPVLGDALYGGTPAPRLCLHAHQLTLSHPATEQPLTFSAPADFSSDPRLALRTALIDAAETNCFRLIHGAADGWPGWYVTRLGAYLLSQSESELTSSQRQWLQQWLNGSHYDKAFQPGSSRGVYHQILNRQVRRAGRAAVSPQLTMGEAAPVRFLVRENGLEYELSFQEGYSVGLFFDQRDNRRRFLTNYIAPDFPLLESPSAAEVLNTFAYTCGFSVCAARAGAKTISLDLSRKYLEWGQRNFVLNQLDLTRHEFIYGDVFDWLRRWTKRARRFDAVILDPPTFSQSRASGVFSAEKDYPRLLAAALGVLKSPGLLLTCTNAAEFRPEEFLEVIEAAVKSARRKILQSHYAPQPPDFPITRSEPGYLKTVWMRLE